MMIAVGDVELSKIFFSFSRKDEEFVKELYRRLAEEGLDCVFEKASSAWAADRVVELEKGLDECEVVVLVLSPAFCRSEWTKIESSGAMADDPAGFRKKLRLLLLEPCEEDLARFLRACRHIDVSTDDKFEAEYPMICKNLTNHSSAPTIEGLVHETTDAPENLAENVCKAVVKEMSRVADECDILSFRQLEKVLPHAELLISSDAIKTEQAIDLANYLCMYYWKRRSFKAAEKFGRKAVEISQRHFEPGHSKIATSQSNLGEVLRTLGQLNEARELLCKALESDEKYFEPGDPVIAVRQSILALVLWDLGEPETARDLLCKALESDVKNFEPGHPKIAIRQSNLAMVLLDLGEPEMARDLAGQAYRCFLEKFGPGHPHTKTAKRNWESLNW